MLDSILEFFESLMNIITGLVDFVITFISDIVYIIQLTGAFSSQVPNYFAWLPSECLAIVGVIFGVVVIYKVLGREG